MTREQKLERFAERELKRIYPELIIEDEQGGLIAFGRYHIKPKDTGTAVYQGDDMVCVFSNRKVAISWCVADRLNNHKLAQSIRTLDIKKQILSADIFCRSGQRDRSRRADFREMVMTKLAPKQAQLALLNQELEKCLNLAKYLQLRGFSK